MEKEFKMEASKLAASKHHALCREPVPSTCAVLEFYVDQAALNYHRNTNHYKEVGSKIGRYVEGKVDVQALTEV